MDLLNEYRSMLIHKPIPQPILLDTECKLVDEITLYTTTEHMQSSATEIRAEKLITVFHEGVLLERKIHTSALVSHESINQVGQARMLELYIVPMIDARFQQEIDQIVAEVRAMGHKISDYKIGPNGRVEKYND